MMRETTLYFRLFYGKEFTPYLWEWEIPKNGLVWDLRQCRALIEGILVIVGAHVHWLHWYNYNIISTQMSTWDLTGLTKASPYQFFHTCHICYLKTECRIKGVLAKIKVFGVLPAYWPLVLDAGTVLLSVPPLSCAGSVYCHCTAGRWVVLDITHG